MSTISNIRIDAVWQQVTKELAAEIIQFWTSYKLLPPGAEPIERVREVVLIIRNDKNEIVGLSTAGYVQFKQLNNSHFFLYRMIVLPPWRVPGIAEKITLQTRDLLEAYAASTNSNKAIGLLTFVENPEIREHRNQAIWPSSKMVFIGTDKDGRHIRVYYFANATI